MGGLQCRWAHTGCNSLKVMTTELETVQLLACRVACLVLPAAGAAEAHGRPTQHMAAEPVAARAHSTSAQQRRISVSSKAAGAGVSTQCVQAFLPSPAGTGPVSVHAPLQLQACGDRCQTALAACSACGSSTLRALPCAAATPLSSRRPAPSPPGWCGRCVLQRQGVGRQQEVGRGREVGLRTREEEQCGVVHGCGRTRRRALVVQQMQCRTAAVAAAPVLAVERATMLGADCLCTCLCCCPCRCPAAGPALL